MKKAVVILLSLFIVLLSASVGAAGDNTTADILKIYGMYNLPSTAELDVEFEKASIEYTEVASKVTSNEMLVSAQSISNESYLELITECDKVIYELRDKLNTMNKSLDDIGNCTVDTIMNFDSTYKTLKSQIVDKEEERKLLVAQLGKVNKQIVFDDIAKDDLERKEKKLDSVQRQLDKAKSYNTIGTLANLKYPLGRTSRVSAAFGWRLDPITRNSMQFHKGVDLDADMNTNVLAIFNGTVEKVYKSETGGNTIFINHGQGVHSAYLHLESFKVKVGDTVKQGQVIAKSGNTGSRTTGPHLHFGLYIGGTVVDPAKLF